MLLGLFFLSVLFEMANKVIAFPVVRSPSPPKPKYHQDVDSYWWRVFTWMKVIGLYPLSLNDSKVITAVSLTLRYGLWVLNVTANIAQIAIFYENQSIYFENSASNQWYLVIQYWNWAVHNIGVHSWIVIVVLRKNKWMKLNKSLAKIEKNRQTNRSLILKDRTQNNQVGIVIFILLLVLMK